MSLVGSMIGGLFGIGSSVLNNMYATQRTEEDRERNYYLNEQAAWNADRRTRALYEDFYAPKALLKQYLEAGLSPSMMFGGTPGQGGMSGAHGAGAGGLQTPYMPVSIVEAAQAAALTAQAEKTKAETQNIKEDTFMTQLEQNWQSMLNDEKFAEVNMFSSYNTDGIILYDEAEKQKTFDGFLDWYKEKFGQVNQYEIKALHKIYTSTFYIDREVSILTNEKVSANFYKSVTEKLEEQDFAEWNAESTVQYLKQNVQTNKLDEEQKKAWNNLLDRIGKRSETAKEVLLIVGMIIDKALTQYRLPSIETGGKTININKNE